MGFNVIVCADRLSLLGLWKPWRWICTLVGEKKKRIKMFNWKA